MKRITIILILSAISISAIGQTYAVLPSGKPVIAEDYDLIDTTAYEGVSFDRVSRKFKRGAVQISKDQRDRIKVIWNHYEQVLKQNTGIKRKKLKKLKAILQKAIKEIVNEKK